MLLEPPNGFKSIKGLSSLSTCRSISQQPETLFILGFVLDSTSGICYTVLPSSAYVDDAMDACSAQVRILQGKMSVVVFWFKAQLLRELKTEILEFPPLPQTRQKISVHYF